MKRDWDIIRAVLEAVEESPSAAGVVRPADIAAWDEELVSYQMLLLSEAGFIVAAVRAGGNRPPLCLARSLTWQGHELLDVMKSRGLWNRVCATLRDQGLSLSHEAIKAAALAGIRKLLSG